MIWKKKYSTQMMKMLNLLIMKTNNKAKKILKMIKKY